MSTSGNKPFVFFFLAIVAISVFMFGVQWHKGRIPSLSVPDNRGIASLFTLDERLVAVYQDGRACVWDWDAFEIKQADFMAGSGRAIPLGDGLAAVVGRVADRRLLTVYVVATGRKTLDLTVGWDDQDVHLRNSPGLTLPTVIRRNAERNDAVEFEFAAVNLSAELLHPPVVVRLEPQTQTLRDFAVSDGGVVYAAGGDDGKARLTALDLNTGRTLWDLTWSEADELTSVAVCPEGRTVWAGDRSGSLLTVEAETGRLIKQVSLLQPGETRTVTNDFSVLNLVVSPDGRRLGCTIAPIAYAVDAATGDVVHRLGGHKVVSKVAFSPDGRKLATSDLRASGVIRIRTLE